VNRLLATLIALTLGNFLGGCATLTRNGGINVSLVNVLPRQASLFETSADLTLRLTNDAREPITLVGSTHRLYLNDTYVGRGVSSERLGLPSLGTATQTVTVYLENLILMRKATELGNARVIAYRLETEFHPADAGRFGNIKAVTNGEFDLSAFTGGIPLPTR
jgi:LEA14-like dessication related protein